MFFEVEARYNMLGSISHFEVRVCFAYFIFPDHHRRQINDQAFAFSAQTAASNQPARIINYSTTFPIRTNPLSILHSYLTGLRRALGPRRLGCIIPVHFLVPLSLNLRRTPVLLWLLLSRIPHPK